MSIIIPEGYKSALNIKDTEKAIKRVKDFFQRELITQLNLSRVSAPLFVDASSGLNDNLNGVERPVSFSIKDAMNSLGSKLVIGGIPKPGNKDDPDTAHTNKPKGFKL